MKTLERVLDVDSTLRGEKIRMGMDEAAVQHIIGVLTDLYSDPELAVIREYSTNALDAHIAAGQTAPIEVTTPTALAPFFRVKDCGIGLDVEDIRNIYSRYGTSTKRDTDEQVGMLGLGCKSALTYSDQFTLVATKNGRTVQVSIGRDEDGGGSMTVVSDEPSDAENGVEVIVPVKRENDYESKAHSFFRFWEKGTVLLNGEEPENIRDAADPIWLIPDKLMVYANPSGGSRYYQESPGWAVMGNVAYPLPVAASKPYQVVAFVDIGAVNFTPSRESLMLTKRTKETLARIEADVERELTRAAQEKITNSPTPREAILAAQEADRFGVKIDGLKYKGRSIPFKLTRGEDNALAYEMDATNSYLAVTLRENYQRRRKNGERRRHIPTYGSDRVIFTDFNAKVMSLTKREKLDAWLEAEGIEKPRELIAVDKLTADERFWLTGTPIYSWEPVQATKVEKSDTVGSSYSPRPRGSYELAYYGPHGSGHIEADDIDTSSPVLYVGTELRYAHLEGTPKDATVVVLPLNRLEKFLRDFPTAMEYGAYIRKEAKDWLDKQDPDRLEIAKYQLSGIGTDLDRLDPDKVDDPDLEAAIRKQTAKVPDVVAGITERQRLLSGFERYTLADKYEHPFKKYPLLHHANFRRDLEHIYLYINAVYSA